MQEEENSPNESPIDSRTVSRRKFFQWGIGSAGTLAATHVLAQAACQGITGPQPLGPFFPKPGTPTDPIREDSNNSTPIFLANDNDLTQIKGRTGVAQGQVVHIVGKVASEDCRPIANATLIIWQASHSGRYNHKGDGDNTDFIHPETGAVIHRTLDNRFQYWGKAVSNSSGEYRFKTIVPGFYPADLENQWYRPPHIHFMITATGYQQLVTQLYFKGEKLVDNAWTQQLNKKDLLLQSSSINSEQRKKLVVEFNEFPGGPGGELQGSFDITLTR